MAHDARRMVFAQPYQVRVESSSLPAPRAGEVCVQTECSAVSAGTELLFYRGDVPEQMQVDTAIAGMGGTVGYPLAYGYACVGSVCELGEGVDRSWLGRRVFAFHPHASHFVAGVDTLQPIPQNLSWAQAALLPNMETAVNLVMDAAPLIGESGLIFGQGVVGLLCTYLLGKFPLSALYASDRYAKRSALAETLGVHQVLSPEAIEKYLVSPGLADLPDFDFIVEVSSNPAALNQAVRLAPFGGRIVIGSWYGAKDATLQLGGEFHRKRVRLLSSQVSTVDGQWQNRWTKQRRLETAWRMLADLPAADLISHRLPIEEAAEAYRLLDHAPGETLQVLFTY